jgi:hypothetical protein
LSRARDATAAALTAAGVEPREDPERRKVWHLKSDFSGCPIDWKCTPRRGYVTYRVTDAQGRFVMTGTPKTIAAAFQKAMPEVRRPPRKDPQHFSTADELSAAAAHREVCAFAGPGTGPASPM